MPDDVRTRGPICLQGGAELQPGCEDMDAVMLLRPDGEPRRVLVAPFAGRAGREQDTAGANARRWYESLGATQVEVATEDALTDALARVAGEGGLLVLPGGSPARLLDALAPHRDALEAAVAGGLALSGASAGAMVVCRWTVLPDRASRSGPTVVPGLALVPVDLVLPHFDGGTGWLDGAGDALPAEPDVLGLPERSGVVVRADGSREALGVSPVASLSPGRPSQPRAQEGS